MPFSLKCRVKFLIFDQGHHLFPNIVYIWAVKVMFIYEQWRWRVYADAQAHLRLLCIMGIFLLLLSPVDVFKKKLLQKILSWKVSVSNCVDPDQDWHSVGTDLDSNCLPRLSADKSPLPRRVVLFLIKDFIYFQTLHASSNSSESM